MSSGSESAEPERDAGHRVWGRLTQARTAFAALLALATAVVSLLFQLVPALKPDPRDRVGADVSIFGLERDVTIRDWIDREFPEAKQAELRKRYPDQAAMGQLLYVRTAVDGHKHRKVQLHVDVFKSRTQRRVPPEDFDAPEIDTVELTAPNERSVHVLWVPDLSLEPPGLFFRVELWDENGMLAIADSPLVHRGRFAANPDAGG